MVRRRVSADGKMRARNLKRPVNFRRETKARLFAVFPAFENFLPILSDGMCFGVEDNSLKIQSLRRREQQVIVFESFGIFPPFIISACVM